MLDRQRATQQFHASKFAAIQDNPMIPDGIRPRGDGGFAATMLRDLQPFTSEGRSLYDSWAAREEWRR